MKERYMKNDVFSLEYDKETLKDMVLELQEENKQLKEKINKLELLIESLKLGVNLNQEQEDLLDKVLFGGDSNE